MVQAQHSNFSVVYTFAGGAAGAFPLEAPLFVDQAGSIFGTTVYGGEVSARQCRNGAAIYGCGVIFKVDPTGTETVLYSVKGGVDGGLAPSSLVQDLQGNLYGTSLLGGDFGKGSVFKLDVAGNWTPLYSFRDSADGAYPDAGLVMDAAGNLYGSTPEGGNLNRCRSAGCGVVFQVNPTGTETIIGTFESVVEGDGSNEALLRDSTGTLFGITYQGGSAGMGNVFRMSSNGKETVLHAFTESDSGGAYPLSSLIADSAGNLYGTANGGKIGTDGYGVVYELDQSGNETVLYDFQGGTDGSLPAGVLVRDQQGNLYGTATFGGIVTTTCPVGCGVIFKLNPNGEETVLHAFTGGADGAFPASGLVPGKTADGSDALYGTTGQGGNSNCIPDGLSGCGTIFKIQAMNGN